MIQANNIHKSYGSLHVLKGVDLQIDRAEVVSIVGKSGAGKSTLLHILGTLDKADSGQLIINEVETQRLESRQLAQFRNLNIGFIFQFHHLLPEFSALENVCIPGFIAKTAEAKVQARAKELLDYLGLSDRLTHKPSQLSGGEQQRVAVARALINNPAIVFADEPTGNLDTKTTVEIIDLFKALHAEGQTIVIVTHEEEVAGFAERIVRLR
ncbi:MAG: ABC transporter ATP-binding protein, partial [Bacteroidota bacterium]